MSSKKQAFESMRETFDLYGELFDRIMKLVTDKVVYPGWLTAYSRSGYFTNRLLDIGYYRSKEYRKESTIGMRTTAKLYREQYEEALVKITEAEEKAQQGLGWLPGGIWIPLEEKIAKLDAGFKWDKESESWVKKEEENAGANR